MRAFFGLSPDPSTKLAIEAWRDKSLPVLESAVPAVNFHITLAFLGQITTKQTELLCTMVDNMSEIHEFDVSLDYVGYWSRPKALWLGTETVQDKHLSLAKKLHSFANSAGLSLPKQKYIPHLTLARKCRENPPAPVITPNFVWRADQFHLFESVSGKNGVAYVIRASWPLVKKFSFTQ